MTSISFQEPELLLVLADFRIVMYMILSPQNVPHNFFDSETLA